MTMASSEVIILTCLFLAISPVVSGPLWGILVVQDGEAEQETEPSDSWWDIFGSTYSSSSNPSQQEDSDSWFSWSGILTLSSYQPNSSSPKGKDSKDTETNDLISSIYSDYIAFDGWFSGTNDS